MTSAVLLRSASEARAALATAVEEPGRMIWEHDGQCQCGARTYLFGQCFRCLREETAEKNRELIDRAVEQDVADPAQEGEEVIEKYANFGPA